MANLIFISYSKKDRDFAWKLADDLVNAGHNIWIDRSLEVGEDWEQTIEKNLAESDEVIVILSSNAIASKWVQHEGSIAYGLKKKIYPVLIEEILDEDLPIWAGKFQYHSFVNVDYGPAFDAFKSALTPQDPIREMLDRKHDDYEANMLLMEPQELEFVATQLNDPNVELSDADKRLLLYSGVAHNLNQPWMALSGGSGVLWLREAIQDRKLPPVVRVGAAASLGAASDGPTYEQLSQVIRQSESGDSKDDALDMLSVFLHHSPEKFKIPSQSRWDVFIRLARLRVKDGTTQRMRMRKAASFITPLCVAIMMTSVYIHSRFSASASNDLIDYVFGAVIFGILGIVVAIGFAEVMTSLLLILRRCGLAWQTIVLAGSGSVIGIALFYLLAGDHGVWFEGGIIGLALALISHKPSHKPGWYSGTLSILVGILIFALSLASPTLNILKVGKPVELLGSAISTGLFSGAYIFTFSQTE